jgi:hypothetical protein
MVSLTKAPETDTPVPCFHWKFCHHLSELEKDGKSVCRAHAALLHGREYPLRTAKEARRGSTGWLNVIEHDLEMEC